MLRTKVIYTSAFIAFFLCQKVAARPSKEEKEARREAFWGLFADTYRAINCLATPEEGSACAQVAITDAMKHSKNVDQVINRDEFEYTSSLLSVRQLVDRIDLSAASDSLLKIKNRLIEDFVSDSAPALVPNLEIGAQKYKEHCFSCHGGSQGVEGPLSQRLKFRPKSLMADWRRASQNPLGIYAVSIHGVDGAEMLPMVDVLDVDELWSIAFHVASSLSFNVSSEVSPDFKSWLEVYAQNFSLVNLAQQSDNDLIGSLRSLGRDCGTCLGEVAYLRTEWLPRAPRLGERAQDERKASEARGLTILIAMIAITSIGFGFVLSRRSRIK